MSRLRPLAVPMLLSALLALGGAVRAADATVGTPAGDPPAAAPVAPMESPVVPAAPADVPVGATAQPAAPAAESASPSAATPAAPAADASSPPPAPAAPARRAELPRPEPVRPSLLPLAQPLWSELSPAQRQVLAPFEDKWNALPVTEKRAWAELALRFPRMKADERKRVEKRIVEWAALTPEQRRIARANYVLAQQIARENLLAEWENYQSMTPDQRTVLGAVGNTTGSNTAARHVSGPTGLATVAAQPLPRRAIRPPAIAVGTDGSPAASGGVSPTVGPAGVAGKR